MTHHQWIEVAVVCYLLIGYLLAQPAVAELCRKRKLRQLTRRNRLGKE